MERDRAAVLTVRSAVSGIIDYREADVLDRRWWRRWRMLINEMATQSDKELLPFALEGEYIACGSYHADNIGPALLGGFVLVP